MSGVSKRLLHTHSPPHVNYLLPSQLCTGGAPVFPSEAKMINDAFCNSKTTVFYGSTESEPISSISTHDLALTSQKQMGTGLPVGTIHLKTTTLILDKTEKEHFFESFTPLAQSQTSRWLSLHENSPTS